MDFRAVDTDTMMDPQGWVVVPVGCAGLYTIIGAVTTNPVLQIRLQILVNNIMVAQSALIDNATDIQFSAEVNRKIRLNVGDTVKLSCRQTNSGGVPQLTWIQPEFRSFLQMDRVGQ
jgi:gamma-glutamyl phosphate reductase